MAGEVTKEELKAMVEVQSKNVEQLTVIANHLSTIVERENKIYERLYNGLSKEISGAIIAMIEKLKEEVEDTKKGQVTQCAAASTTLKATISEELKNCGMARDIGHTKWFIGIVGVIVVVATLIVNSLTRQGTEHDFTVKLQKAFEQYTERIISHDEVVHKDVMK